MTDLLAGACRRQPLVLVIEDGHWADGPTLQLLRHLARSVPDARLLVLATFRDTEADVPAELADALADLRRSDDVVRLRLGGLTDDDVAEYVRRSAGAEVDPALAELAHAIRALTEGNAFLLSELWRTLVEIDAIAVTEGGLRLTRPLEEIATPRERPRGREPAALPPRRRRPATCSSSPPSPGPSSSSTCCGTPRPRS